MCGVPNRVRELLAEERFLILQDLARHLVSPRRSRQDLDQRLIVSNIRLAVRPLEVADEEDCCEHTAEEDDYRGGPAHQANSKLSGVNVILVEGISDKVAVETLARRYGRDLAAEGTSVVAIGGAHSIRRFLDGLGPDATVVGLCDAGEREEFRQALGANHYVCDADLEDELIRALGVDAVEEVVEAQGDLRAFRTLQKQAAWQGRPTHDQLRRFMGSGGRRKIRYAQLLVDALDVSQVPRPLDAVLAHAGR
jgi:hypothetical protein